MVQRLFWGCLLLVLTGCTADNQVSEPIDWVPKLSKEVFQRAGNEKKLVLLTLEANWCHWCHVMEDSTFSSPEVRVFLKEHFVCVAVDQDRAPELASRYRKYGWPATIVLNANGDELLKKAGFMNPKEYLSTLRSVLNGKSQEESRDAPRKEVSTEVLISRLTSNFDRFLDFDDGGFTSAMKYVEEDSYLYARFVVPDRPHQRWMRKTIEGAYDLCDPVWGGVYQYSTHGDWRHPHYEKLLSVQARYLRLFASDFNFTESTQSRLMIEQINGYCDRFLLQKNKLYANAQDADVVKGEKATSYFALNNKDRLKKGIPGLDTATYTHSNADFARAILFCHASGIPDQLPVYRRMLDKLLQRKNAKGLYSHTYRLTQDTEALRDNLAMAHLLIEHLKVFPADRKMATELARLLKRMTEVFQMKSGGFQGFSGNLGIAPEPVAEENILLGRLVNWYAAFSGQEQYRTTAKGILKYLLELDSKEGFFHEPGLVQLAQELESESRHYVTVREGKDADMLLRTYALAPFYSCFEVYKPGVDPSKDDLFGGMHRSALFCCTASYCSSPMYSIREVEQFFRGPF